MVDTPGALPPRDSDEPRDHLNVFREFIDHLERTARTAAATRHSKRRRTSAR